MGIVLLAGIRDLISGQHYGQPCVVSSHHLYIYMASLAAQQQVPQQQDTQEQYSNLPLEPAAYNSGGGGFAAF